MSEEFLPTSLGNHYTNGGCVRQSLCSPTSTSILLLGHGSLQLELPAGKRSWWGQRTGLPRPALQGCSEGASLEAHSEEPSLGEQRVPDQAGSARERPW